MKKKSIFILVAVLAAFSLASCKGNTDEPTPGPGPGPDPGPESEISSNNAAPAGFVDDGPMDWDE